MARARAVGSQQDLCALDVLLRNLVERVFSDRDLIGRGVRAGVPGPQLSGERFTGLIGVGEHRVKPVAALEVPGSALLLRMRAHERRVQVDIQQLRGSGELPHTRSCPGVSTPQPLEPIGVARDPVDDPERRRVRTDRPEQGGLIAERAEV